MADIGRLPEETYPLLAKWIDNGGTLIRFAGPRLAAAPADDPLVPVTLRQGERALGGALSWSGTAAARRLSRQQPLRRHGPPH